MRTAAITLLIVLAIQAPAHATCGTKGGPGYRGPDGHCVAWPNLRQTCGCPPSNKCSPEQVDPNADKFACGRASAAPTKTMNGQEAPSTARAAATEPCYAVDAKGHSNYVQCLRQQAEQGDADAQYNLGFFYRNGQELPQDYEEAAKWFRRSANQGRANSQFALSGMYQEGMGVRRDVVQAHMRANLAAAQGIGMAGTMRMLIEEKMTRAQVLEAQKMAGENGSQSWRVQ